MARKTKRKKQKRKIAPEGSTDEIISLLAEISQTTGAPPGEVFLDWMTLLEITLDSLPRHIRAFRQSGDIDIYDPPEISNTFARLRERYPERSAWKKLAQADGILIWFSVERKQDTIGQIYARWAFPQDAQRILPFEQALKLAKETLGDDPADIVRQRLARAGSDAAERDPLARSIIQSAILADQRAETKTDQTWLQGFAHSALMPAILPYYHPPRVFDPATASGSLVVAASSLFPESMVELGLIRFEGAEADPICLKMTQLNARLYGLNGYYADALRAVAEAEGELTEISLFGSDYGHLSEAEIAQLPPAFQSAYAQPASPQNEGQARPLPHHLSLFDDE